MMLSQHGQWSGRERMRPDPRTPNLESRQVGEKGAALVTVLLFVVLVFILITAMLSVTGNEVVIAGLQRDGVRATELAQAGIQEAVTRIMAGRPYMVFTSSLAPACPASPQCVSVRIINQYNGDGSAYLEIQADATVGRSTRRLSRLVLSQAISYPPDITFAASVTETGSAAITCGDAYARTFLQYKDYPTNSACPTKPQPVTNAGWRVSKVSPGPVTACYRARPWMPGQGTDCALANAGSGGKSTDNNQNVQAWYPSMRLGASQTSSVGQDILGFQANAAPANSCLPTNPAYNATLPGGAILQNELSGSGVPMYGYDTDTPPMLTKPSGQPVASQASGSGNLNGTYTFVVTYWTASGESYASDASLPISVTNKNINLSSIPIGPAGTVARGIYAFKSAGQPGARLSSSYRLAGVIPNNTATTFTVDVDLLPNVSGGPTLPTWTTPLPTTNVSQLDPDLFPCGLPYKWVPMDYPTLTDENGAPLSGGDVAGRRWFKTIVFEQWLKNYWWFDESQLTFTKRGNGHGTQPCVDDICVKVNVTDSSPSVQPDLLQYPQFGAVPPFPDFSTFTSNYDCKISGGGVLNSLPVPCTKPDGSASTTDLGCQNPPMTGCTTNSKVIEMDGNWTINGNIGGHGTIIVNGDLVVNGTFTYWGTIVVNGTLQAGTGNVNVYGGLVAQDTLKLIGNITVQGGTTVGGTPPSGPANVIGKAWWQR